MSSQITEATAEDAEAIRDLATRIWNLHYPGIISQEQIDYMLGWMYAPEKIREEIGSGEIVYLKVFAGACWTGFAAFDRPRPGERVFIHKIYIHPDSQRRGLGSLTFREIEERSRRAGARSLALRVNRENHQAVAAYRKNGFEVEEELRSDIGGGFVMDDYVMGKALGP